MEGGGEKMEGSPNTIEYTFFNYLNGFLGENRDLQKQQSPIFLKRQGTKTTRLCKDDLEYCYDYFVLHSMGIVNVSFCSSRNKRLSEDDEQTALVRTMHNMFIANGLDCKVSSKTYRVRYLQTCIYTNVTLVFPYL
jgi:hypothetical protein